MADIEKRQSEVPSRSSESESKPSSAGKVKQGGGPGLQGYKIEFEDAEFQEEQKSPQSKVSASPGEGGAVSPHTPGLASVGAKGAPTTPSPDKSEAHAPFGDEVTVLTAAEMTGLKAEEHAALAAEHQRKMEAKQREMASLRRQAENLENQSDTLLLEADEERKRLESGMKRKEQIQHVRFFPPVFQVFQFF